MELRRAVEEQLKQSHAKKGAASAMRLEFRAAVNMFQRSRREFVCGDPKCKLCASKRAECEKIDTGILKDSYYIRRQRGKGFDGATLLDRWGYQLQLVLVDIATGAVVSNSGPVKIELSILKGDFEAAEWTTDEYDRNVHHATTGSGDLLKNATFVMENGVAVVPETFFVLQPSYNFKPRTFRLGARALNLAGVKEARSEGFAVKTGRSLSDEKKRAAEYTGVDDVTELPVKKLPGIGRAAVDKLEAMDITTVEQFVERMQTDAHELRKILKMSDRQWDEATVAAKQLVVEAAPPIMWFKDKARTMGIMFDPDHYPVALALPLDAKKKGADPASGVQFMGKKFEMISVLDEQMTPEKSALLLQLQNEAYTDWFKPGHPNYIAMPRGAQQSLEVLHVTSEGGGRKDVTDNAMTAVREAQRKSAIEVPKDAPGIAAYIPPVGELPAGATAFQRQVSSRGGAGMSNTMNTMAGAMLNHMAAGPQGTQDHETLLNSMFPMLSEGARQSTLEMLRNMPGSGQPMSADAARVAGIARGASTGAGARSGDAVGTRGSGGVSLGLGAALAKDKQRAPAPISTPSLPASMDSMPPAPPLFSPSSGNDDLATAPPMLGAMHQNSFVAAIPPDLTARQVSLDMLKLVGPAPIGPSATGGGDFDGQAAAAARQHSLGMDLGQFISESLTSADRDEAAHLIGAAVRQGSMDALAQFQGSLTRKRSARIAGIPPDDGRAAKR